jgi:hypothetical protein
MYCYGRSWDRDAAHALRLLAATLAEPGVTAFHEPATGGRPTSIPMSLTARYVRVQLKGTAPLSLAEVEVLTKDD